MIFLDCKKQKNELICPITKDKFIENLENSNTTLDGGNIQYLDYKYDMARNQFPMISKINLVYESSKKEDIYVGITKCLTDYTELKTYVTYETNVTNIKKVKAYLTLPIEG